MKNILVVNINWLGDAIFSTPVFKALKAAYPQARISCLCVPRVKEVLKFCPFIDEILVYEEKGKHAFVWGKLEIISRIRSKKFDAAFILHRSMTRALLVFLAGIPLRIGFSKAKFLLTHAVATSDESIHRADTYLKVVEEFGIKPQDRSCELSLKLEDIKSLDRKLVQEGIAEGEDFVVFNPGGNWDLKRWPLEYWAQLASQVSGQLQERIIIAGGPSDKGLAEDILQRAKVKAIVLAGKTSLGESLALFKRAQAVISADSGPLHLAQAVGAKVIALYGPTRPEITGLRGKGSAEIIFKEIGCNKAPCYHLGCGNNLCMRAIEVNDVLQVIKKFIC